MEFICYSREINNYIIASWQADFIILPCVLISYSAKCSKLKEYYEIVDEARPLSGFFPTHADFFTEMHFYS